VDLRVGGKFSSRMEAKDGSFGFNFADFTWLPEQVAVSFGSPPAKVEFYS
jgi:hypothetical protein